ncbi:hypothetical protein Nepgr_033916 [Nepenthes gracilis]|uniref:Uncharacterized protein n=1 Tax=Nepenthes gracilis TaxID=150966 RepID=A0AAD3TN54_NEPGR|nr:hypothetical protein Nepgr_033916 [Nepenthes gracilis]
MWKAARRVGTRDRVAEANEVQEEPWCRIGNPFVSLETRKRGAMLRLPREMDFTVSSAEFSIYTKRPQDGGRRVLSG